MVLYKRKQVTFVHPPQLPQDLSTEVYIIPETREWFMEYEEYLQRLDYYKHRKFVCEITGNSCLTFFEALESEIKEIQGVERDFPEALREHILRFLQFNRITRLDQLVDKVYLVFKGDYFPGETIYIKGSISSATVGQTKQKGTVREKVQYNNPEDGTSSTKYLVVRLNDMRQAIVTGDKILRDRNHFTKWLIKTFIKLTMTRSHKVGAPWVVKDKYAKKYRIPQEYPEDLKHFELFTPSGEVTWEGEKKRQRRGKAGGKNSDATKEDTEGTAANGTDGKEEAGSAPAKKGRRKKKTEEVDGTEVKKGKRKRKEDKKDAISEAEAKVGTPPVVPKKKVLSFPVHYVPDNLLKKEIIPPAAPGVNSGTPATADTTTSGSVPISTLQPTQKTIIDDLELKFDLQRLRPLPLQYSPPDNSNYWENNDDQEEEEDEDQEDEVGAHEPLPIQKALECWAFLNIYHKVLNLDTFTFDDFMYAIGWNYDQFEEIGRCELLDEMFCAVLGVIVSNETPKKGSRNEDDDEETIPGLLITLPPKKLIGSAKVKDTDEMDEERGSDTENENENGVNSDKSETDSDSEDEQEAKEPKKLKTKRGEKKVEETEEAEDADEEDEGDGDDEAAEDEDENADGGEDGDNDFHEHNAYLVMNYRNIPWYERLRKRNFKDGNWQCIMMGVFSIVEYVPAFKPVIDKVYKVLAPTDDESSTRNGGIANPSSVLRQFYEELNINLRIQCLNILISLLSGGKVVRGYIDDCLDVSTALRRDRLDNIRDYKVQLELVSQYHSQIQARLEEYIKKYEPVKEEVEEKENEIAGDTIEADGKKTKTKKKAGEEKNEKDSTPATAPDSKDTRSRSKISLLAEMTPIEEELASTDKEFLSLWEKKRIELTKISELKKAKKEIELKLVEMDCQRVKLLGKDRFGNRYWWFENNGLPTLHGSSNGDEDEDNSGANTVGVNGTAAADDMDDDEDELLDETYLMGKLWIQGPSQEDVSELLHLDDTQILNLQDVLDKKHPTANGSGKEDINRYIKSEIEEKGWYDEVRKDYKEMDFASTVPKYYRRGVEKLYGITYLKKQIIRQNTEEIIVDHFGLLPPKSNWQSLTPMQRKLIEEASDPLISLSDWRYYDKREDIEKLLQWINPWGSRESQLRKELLVVKDAICQSMDGRRKALWLDKIPDHELEIEKQLEEVIEKIKQKVGNTQTEPDIEASDVPSDTSENLVEILPRGKRRAAAMAAVSSMSTSKRQRKDTSHGPPDTIANGTVEELRKLQEDLEEKLSEKKKEKELSRILEWVNLGAREEFDKSLYEGGDKQKIKKRKK